MNELSLFTGIGGGVYAARLLGWRTVGYVERADYCQQIIRARIDDGTFEDAPIFGSVESFIGEGYADAYSGLVGVLTAGYPCQRFSSATRGRRVAANLWPETRQCISIIRPSYVMLENVAGARESLEHARCDLESMGYRVHGPEALSASDLGAPFPGERLWVVAATDVHREPTFAEHGEVAELPTPPTSVWTDVERGDLGMVDGTTHRGKRLAATGNAQVPLMAATAWIRGMSELFGGPNDNS